MYKTNGMTQGREMIAEIFDALAEKAENDYVDQGPRELSDTVKVVRLRRKQAEDMRATERLGRPIGDRTC